MRQDCEEPSLPDLFLRCVAYFFSEAFHASKHRTKGTDQVGLNGIEEGGLLVARLFISWWESFFVSASYLVYMCQQWMN